MFENKVSAFCYSWPTHINGMYVCVLGIPKDKFSKQMKKKYLVTNNNKVWPARRTNTVILKFEAVKGDAPVVAIPSISYAATVTHKLT
jgi:hypothetical protein